MAAPVPDDGRVVSIADLHGDYPSLVRLLQHLGLVDGSGAWAGGRATLVQTGDQVDRGPESIRILKALVQLRAEAERAGGRVILLFGNHEVMEMQGMPQYAHPEEVRAMGGESGWQRAWDLDGEVGALVREHLQAVAVVGGTLFTHAGVLPQLVEPALTALSSGGAIVDALNDWVREHLRQPMSELGSIGEVSPATVSLYLAGIRRRSGGPFAHLAGASGLVFGDVGPFWVHTFGAAGGEGAVPDADMCSLLNRTLSAFAASRMVMGHMPQSQGRVHERCGGRLLLADTAISSAMLGPKHNHPAALEFDTRTGEAVAHYLPPTDPAGGVVCGGHTAPTCAECGDSAGWCNGECAWRQEACRRSEEPIPPEGLRVPLSSVPGAARPMPRPAATAVELERPGSTRPVPTAAVLGRGGSTRVVPAMAPHLGGDDGFAGFAAMAAASYLLLAIVVLRNLRGRARAGGR